MKKVRLLSLLGLVLCAALAGAQATVPGETPKADGAVTVGEYRYSTEWQGIKLGVQLSADRNTLYVAVQAPTAGWVAAGLGSLRMNGAFMVLGYSQGGKGYVSEETGSARGHKPNPGKRLTAWAVSESGSGTVLEFSVPAAGFLKGDSVEMILAYGTKDDFVSKHAKYGSATIPLK